MIIKANAKINKYLKVLGKREDGFHELETLMIPIDLYDYIEIEKSECDLFECLGENIGDNIVLKALKLFREKTGINESVKIKVTKNIPIGAGLGGGSSDAVFTIKGLNELFNTCLSKKALEDMALELGSDTLFFVNNKPQIISGRGEKSQIVELEKIYGVLVFDGDFYSTKLVFENFDKKEVKRTELNNDLLLGIEGIYNIEKIQNIKALLLESGCYYSEMTGSGSSVFGLCRTRKEAETICEKIKNKYLKVVCFESIEGKGI